MIQHRLMPLGRFAAYTAVGCAIVAVFVLCWVLRDVMLLAFGAVIFAVIIRALADPLIERGGIREQLAIPLVVVLLLAAMVGVSWLLGKQVTSQLQGLNERLPQALQDTRAWLEGFPTGQFILEKVSAVARDTQWAERAQSFFTISLTTLAHALLMLFAGIYLAVNPKLYVNGVVSLFPVSQRKEIAAALKDSGLALRKWLLGQIVSMVSIGTLTGVGLWAVGAPLPLALGIMAGLLEFIPIVGPFIAFVPGVMVALTEGPQVAVYAAIIYLAVQQLEGSVISPLAQRWAVKLPPAYGLLSLVAFGLLFGFLGIFFGSPLAVVLMCLVQTLYIKNGLENARP